MKKLTIFLAFLFAGLVGLAQKTFTESTLRKMFLEYQKDSNAFFINRLADDFRYSNPQGMLVRKTDVAAGGKIAAVQTTDAQKILASLQSIQKMLQNTLANDVLEPVIFQSSDLAVLTGIQKMGDDGTIACTHTFQNRKGKWIFVASQQTSVAE